MTRGLGEVRIMAPKHLAGEAKEISGISDKNNIKLQDQVHDKSTWFKPLCLILLLRACCVKGFPKAGNHATLALADGFVQQALNWDICHLDSWSPVLS